MRILSFDFSTKNCENDEDLMLQYAKECFDSDSIAYQEEAMNTEEDSPEDFSTENCEYDEDFIVHCDKECSDSDEDFDLSDPPQLLKEPTLKKTKKKAKSKSSFEGVCRYVLGYGLFKKVKCSDCQAIMKKSENNSRGRSTSNKNEVFIKEKDFGKSKGCEYLCNPSDYFLSIFNCQFHTFSQYYPENKHIINLKAILLKKCMSATNNISRVV